MVSESRGDVVPGSELTTEAGPTKKATLEAPVIAGAEVSAPIWRAVLPETAHEMVEALEALEEQLIGQEPVEVPTEHVLHAGMYARTVAMPAGMVLTGVLIKIPTLVTVVGSCAVLVGEEWLRLEGYNVLPGAAGRKAVFVSYTSVIITMVFPTQAKTVEEAEAEFTDEADRLLSRRQKVRS